MTKRYPIGEVLQPIFGLVLAIKKISDRSLNDKLDITVSQFRMLVAINYNQKVSQQTIAEFWNMTEASASRQIDLLCKKKLVVKTRNPNNKRECVLKLTKHGEEQIKRASSIMTRVFESIFKDISNDKRKKFASLLSEFYKTIKKNEVALAAGEKRKLY